MKHIFIFLLFVQTVPALAQQSLAEKLGYTNEDKLLIIHADDLAVAHSENIATFLAMKAGSVNSASVMMPCGWVSEVADYKKENPERCKGSGNRVTSSNRKSIRYGIGAHSL